MRIAAIAAAACLAATADAARTGIVAAPGAVARAAGAAGPPAMTLTFAATMHIAGGYGHDGDGCVAAEAALEATPTISRIWFDAANERLAQTNPDLERPDPRPNTTFVGLFEDTPPTAIAVTDNGAGHVQCETEPLPKGFCPNGTRACPPDFGTWGTVLTPFAAVLGTFYPNTTLLSETADADLWQYTSVTNTKMPNGTYIDVTRNYTYTIGKSPSPDGSFPLSRFTWTQSIPLEPAKPLHRDCFIFDYATDYTTTIDASRWEAPEGVTCSHRPVAERPGFGEPLEARLASQ